MSREGLIKRPVIPAAQTAVVLSEQEAAIPWYQFFDDLKRIAIDAEFPSAVEFSASDMTAVLGIAHVYRFTGVSGASLALDANLLALGSANAVFIFAVVDEGGAAGINPLTISAGTGTINGAPTFVIDSNYGSSFFYTNGTDFFTL